MISLFGLEKVIVAIACLCLIPVANAQDLPKPVQMFLEGKSQEYSELINDIRVSRYYSESASNARERLPFGTRFILVNIPNQMLYAFEPDGTIALKSRVIVGKPETPTPVFRGRAVASKWYPDWTAPASIGFERLDNRVNSGMMVRDGNFKQFRAKGRVEDLFTAEPAEGTDGQEITVSSEDMIDSRYFFYIPPSNSGPMGKVKLMINGADGIFLHDTDQPALFGNEQRLLSHGCVRVEKAPELAAWSHRKEPSWAEKEAEIAEMRYQSLPRSIPAVFAYFLETDFDGNSPVKHDDVYKVRTRSGS